MVKKGLTKLETLDPDANLTEADLNDLGLKMDLKFYKAKKFNEFLQKKPLLGGDLNDDNEGIGKQVLSFAIENFRSSPQKFSSQPKMLHQVIELIKEQNHDNPKVLSQLAQELVRVSNKANWPLAILDLDLEIKKLEKLGAKIENYHYGSLSEAERKHFLNIAHIICKTDSNPNIKGNVANVINLSAENLPTEAEMVSVHKSIQALEPRIGRIPASAFLISSLKEITEAYIKTQIHSHGDFRKAINVMEVAQNSPSHRLVDDIKEGRNELRDFTIGEIAEAGAPILKDHPESFLDFLQRGPLFSSNLNHDFTEKTLQFGIYMAIDQPEILDKTIELFKEQYKDNDQALEDLTNKLIEYSNLLSEDQLKQKALNTKIIEHLGPLLSADHIDINKIIAQAAKNKNISLVSALILNNSSSDIKPNLAALKLMHDTGDIAAEKLLQRPEEAIDYLRSSDSLDDNLFNMVISKIHDKLDRDEILILLECSNSIKSLQRRNEINQRIEKNLDDFIKTASDIDVVGSIQNATYYENPQLLNSMILHSDGRKITTATSKVIKSLQLLHKEGYLDATAKMLEEPEQALLLIQESMNKTTKDYNPVSNELFDIIVTTLITSPTFNANRAEQLIKSIDSADEFQRRIIYRKMQEYSAELLSVAAENTQILIDRAAKDKEVGLLSVIINHPSTIEINVNLETLKLLYNREQFEAVETLLEHPNQSTRYLVDAIDQDIDPKLFAKIIEEAVKIDPSLNYEEDDIDHPHQTLIDSSNRARNSEQRKALNAQIAKSIPEFPEHSIEDEDYVNEATAAKNGELLSILITKNIIWSKDINLETLEILLEGKYTAAIDKLLKDQDLAANLLFEAAKTEIMNQKLVDLLIPYAIKERNVSELLLDKLLPKITSAEQLNQIIDSQKDKEIALKATTKDIASIGLLSPENTAILTGVMLDKGIDVNFSEVLRKTMEETYNKTKTDLRPLSLKLAEKIYPKNLEKLTSNDNYNKAVADYEKKLTSFDKQPILTKMRAFFARSKSKKVISELEKEDILTRMKGFFARKDSAAKYKTMKVNEKLSAIKTALNGLFSAVHATDDTALSKKAQQAAKEVAKEAATHIIAEKTTSNSLKTNTNRKPVDNTIRR